MPADNLPENMGMTGVEPAYHGLKARCIAVLLHTQMSEVPCPVLLDEWDAAAIGFEPISQDSKSWVMPLHQTASAQMDSNHPGWFCRPLWPPDPAHEDGQCSSWTNSCGFSVRRYYRVSLLSFFCRITPTIEKQDTKNSMIKSHSAIGWNCCMCPTARWIGLEPITSAFG